MEKSNKLLRLHSSSSLLTSVRATSKPAQGTYEGLGHTSLTAENMCVEGLAGRPSANHPSLAVINFQDRPEHRVFGALRVWQDPQVPRVNLAVLAPLG